MDSNYYGKEYEEDSYCGFSEQESQYCSDYAYEDDYFWELTSKDERFGDYDNDDVDDDDVWELTKKDERYGGYDNDDGYFGELTNKDERYGDYDNDDDDDDYYFWELTNKDERYGDYDNDDDDFWELTNKDEHYGDYENDDKYCMEGNKKNCFSDGVSRGTLDRDRQWNSYIEDNSQKSPISELLLEKEPCMKLMDAKVIMGGKHKEVNLICDYKKSKRKLKHPKNDMDSRLMNSIRIRIWKSNVRADIMVL